MPFIFRVSFYIVIIHSIALHKDISYIDTCALGIFPPGPAFFFSPRSGVSPLFP